MPTPGEQRSGGVSTARRSGSYGASAPAAKAATERAGGFLNTLGLQGSDLTGLTRAALGAFGLGGGSGGVQVQNSSNSNSSVSVNPAITVISGGGSPGVSTGGGATGSASASPSQRGQFGLPLEGGGAIPSLGAFEPRWSQLDPGPVTNSGGGGGGMGLDFDGLILPAALAAGAFLLTQKG
jgi:hypothetical protein